MSLTSLSNRLPLWWLGIALVVLAPQAWAQQLGGVFAEPAVAARSAVLLNPSSGEILFAKEPHLRLPPASTTKVLTALVTLERLDLNSRLMVSPQAASAPPSRIGLRAGDAALTQDLLYGLMLKSGNDAAEALAEGAGGSVPGFAEMMNAKAWQVGARNSHFMNPHGLPNEEHYSTAYDLALIFRQAMYHPLFAEIVRTHSAALRVESGRSAYGDARMIPVVSHNRLLTSYEGARGGKTGFTFKARRCYVGEVERGGVRLIVAILNSPTSATLWNDARNLLDYGFARYGLAAPPPVRTEPKPVMARWISEESDQVAARQMLRGERPRAQVAPAKPRVVPAAPVVVAKHQTPRTAARPAPVAVAAPKALPARGVAAHQETTAKRSPIPATPIQIAATAKAPAPKVAVANSKAPPSAVKDGKPAAKVARAEAAHVVKPKPNNAKRGG